MKCAVFVFPHQDDEIGAYSAIEQSLLRGERVICAYTTAGADLGSPLAAARAQESEAALIELGVDRQAILHLGINYGWQLDTVHQRLDETAAVLKGIFDNEQPSRIYLPAWEGGHQDHDATHLAGVAAAFETGMHDRVVTYFMYRAPLSGPMPYLACAPIPGHPEAMRATVPFRRALKYTQLLFIYRTQFRAMVGLGPFFVFRWLILRGVRYGKPVHSSVYFPPLPGRPLYERHKRLTWAEFREATKSFFMNRIANIYSNS